MYKDAIDGTGLTWEREEALLDRNGDSVTAIVYLDESDPANPGPAYRLTWDNGPRAGHEETGPCDSPDPWQDVYRFLGREAAYSDGTPLPIAEHDADDSDNEDESLVLGREVRIDRSGVGHHWVDAGELPANIREEIAAEILDGGKESCEDYVASNGLHYRW